MTKLLDTDARRRRAVYDGQSRLGDIQQGRASSPLGEALDILAAEDAP